MRRTVAVLGAVAVLTVPGCGGDEGASPAERRKDAGSKLEDVPLREDEVPEGLALSERGTGPIVSLREVLPPRSAVPNLPPVPPAVREGFAGGFEVAYRREGGGGPASAASSAIRFSGEDAAGSFVSFLREVQVGAGRGIARAEVTVSALGDQAFGWHTREPLGESSAVVWHTGDLVLTVSLGGRIGTSQPERAIELARRVQRRVGGS